MRLTLISAQSIAASAASCTGGTHMSILDAEILKRGGSVLEEMQAWVKVSRLCDF